MAIKRLRSLGPVTNDARMAAAIAQSDKNLVDVASLSGKQRTLRENQIKGFLKETVARDIEGLSPTIMREDQYLKMSSSTKSSRRADAPLFEGLTVAGEVKDIILQVKAVSGKLSKNDLQQLVTSIRSANQRDAVVHLYLDPDTLLTWSTRSAKLASLHRQIMSAIERGRLTAFRIW